MKLCVNLASASLPVLHVWDPSAQPPPAVQT